MLGRRCAKRGHCREQEAAAAPKPRDGLVHRQAGPVHNLEALLGSSFEDGILAASGPLEGSENQARVAHKGSGSPWTVFRVKRRLRRPAQPVLSSSPKWPQAEQDLAHMALDSAQPRGLGEDGCGRVFEETQSSSGCLSFSTNSQADKKLGLTGAVFFPPSFAEDPNRVRSNVRTRRKKAHSQRPGLRFSPGLKAGPSGPDEGNDDTAPLSGSAAKPSRGSGMCSQASQGLGPFPSAQSTCVSRTKPRVRTKRSSSDLTPEHVLLRQVRCRLRLWKRLREVLVHHSCIPEDEESLLIELAEQEGVKDNEDGLEGWVAFQLLSKVSEQATKGFEILTLAVEDIIDQLSSKGTRILTVRSSNITQWRPEIQKWIQAQPDDVLLLQETHLGSSAISQAVAAVHKAGYEMFGGEAAPGRKGTHGGVAVLVRSHLQARTTFHFTVEGCGFSSVTLRIRGISLLLVSLYLKCSTPLHSAPNASILGRLASSLKNHHGHWLVAGDFNVQPKELAATSFLSEVRGRLVCLGEATTQGGSELDFALTSNGIEGSVSIAMDWSAPHRPHGGLRLEVRVPGTSDKAFRLPDFPIREADDTSPFQLLGGLPDPIEVLGQDFTGDSISKELAALTRSCQEVMYPRESIPRGGSLVLTKRPRVAGQSLWKFSTQASLWLRVESWLNVVGAGDTKISSKSATNVIEQLQWDDGTTLVGEEWRAELLAHLTKASNMATEKVSCIRVQIAEVQSEHLRTGLRKVPVLA